MELWLNWLVGFIIWFFCIALLALITFLISAKSNKNLRGRLPDEAFNYSFRPSFIPEDAFLLDTHSHTIASDGWMTAEQNIKWHIANGYQAFVLTDHNTGKLNEEILSFQDKYPEIVIIPGYEYTTPRVHINMLGIKDFEKPTSRNPSDEELQRIINKAHDMGAVVQLDHYTWTQDRGEQRNGQYTHPSRENLIKWGIDGFEINNEMRWYDPYTVILLEQMKKEGKLDRPVFLSTGTDVHSPISLWATCWTEILLTPEAKQYPTWEVIKKAMLEGRTKIWVNHDWRRTHESQVCHTEEKRWIQVLFAPFLTLGDGIGTHPGELAGILSHILWFLVMYFPLRLLFSWMVTL